ncbi:hypothetical protein SAMN05443253_11459 [Bacillus sp. OK048]|nr:hypothetical protein SAMN05443253_11459 [Bacillus sp. OK048]
MSSAPWSPPDSDLERDLDRRFAYNLCLYFYRYRLSFIKFINIVKATALR